MFQKKCDENIEKTLEIAEKMIRLAYKGNDNREDDSCGVLYGILLDSGFKIKKLAKQEKQAHIKKRLLEDDSMTKDAF